MQTRWMMSTAIAVAVTIGAGCGAPLGERTEESAPLEAAVPAGDRAGVPEGSLQSFVQQSAEFTDAVETFRFSLTVDASSAAGAETGPMLRADGVVDDPAGRASIITSLPVLPGGNGGQGLESLLGPATDPTELVVDGGDLYVRGGAVALLTGRDVGWVRVPTGKGRSLGLGLSGAVVADLVDVLRNAGDVTDLGTEVIDGVEVSRLRVDVDEADVASRLPVGADVFDTSSLEVTVDVWIGGDGLLRRLVVVGTADDAPSVTLHLELSALGEPADIIVPDPDEVTDLASAFDGLGNLFERLSR